jgi:hypothetical protein
MMGLATDPAQNDFAPAHDGSITGRIRRLAYLKRPDVIRTTIANDTGKLVSVDRIERVLADMPKGEQRDIGEPTEADGMDYAPGIESHLQRINKYNGWVDRMKAEQEMLRQCRTCDVTGEEIDQLRSMEILRDAARRNARSLPLAKKLAFEVADELGLDFDTMFGPARSRPYPEARAVVYLLLRERDPIRYSLPQIGKIFGGRDHSSIHNGLRNFEMYCKRDARLWPLYKALGGKRDG